MAVKLVCIIRFFSYFTQAIFFPFFAVWLFDEKLLTIMQAATVVSIGILMVRLAGLIFAPIVKRYPKKYAVNISLLSIALLYALIWALAKYNIAEIWIWLFIAIALGSFIAVNSLALLAATAIFVKQERHLVSFSFLNIALNLSAGIGPFIGGFILFWRHEYLPIVPILFVLIAILFALKLPKDQPESATLPTKQTFAPSNKDFWYLMVLNFLSFASYAQFYDIFAAYGKNFIGERMIGFLFLLSGLLVVALQTIVTKSFEKINLNRSLIIANLILALGTVFFISAAYSIVILCAVAVLLITISELIYVPLYQTQAIKLYAKEDAVQALALLSFTWGISESIATFFGLLLIGHNHGNYSYLIGTISALLAVVLLIWKKLPTHTDSIPSQ